MSGRPGFANIKHRKECNDVAKGKIFTVIDREITVAVKEDGAGPANNSKLGDIITKARANNVPNDTIDRGIKKAAGDANSVDYETLTHEGHGPNGVAIIVDALTDNKNRTAANVGSALTKGGGSIGTSGSVSYMFDRKGQTIIDKEECGMDPDELMMLTLDAGTENFSEGEDNYEVVMVPEDFSVVRGALEAQSIPMMQADTTMIPQAWVGPAGKDDVEKLNHTLGLLDEGGDTQAVHYNWDE